MCPPISGGVDLRPEKVLYNQWESQSKGALKRVVRTSCWFVSLFSFLRWTLLCIKRNFHLPLNVRYRWLIVVIDTDLRLVSPFRFPQTGVREKEILLGVLEDGVEEGI